MRCTCRDPQAPVYRMGVCTQVWSSPGQGHHRSHPRWGMTLETRSLGCWKFIPKPPARADTPHRPRPPAVHHRCTHKPGRRNPVQTPAPTQLPPHAAGALQPPRPSPASSPRVRGPGRAGCCPANGWQLPSGQLLKDLRPHSPQLSWKTDPEVSGDPGAAPRGWGGCRISAQHRSHQADGRQQLLMAS